MIYIISRTDEHFINWMNEQQVSPRLVKRIINFRDATYIKGNEGYVMLTPMEDQREEERIRILLKSKKCYELPHIIDAWPLTEFM
jgi:hypothetical protein